MPTVQVSGKTSGKISSSTYNQRYHDGNNSHSAYKPFSTGSSTSGTSGSGNGRDISTSIVLQQQQNSKGKNRSRSRSGTSTNRVQYLFGRKFVNRSAMPRPSVAEALGYQPKSQSLPMDSESQYEARLEFSTATANANASNADMEFNKKHPSLEFKGFKFDPIQEDEDDDFHYSDDESDSESDSDSDSDGNEGGVSHDIAMGKINSILALPNSHSKHSNKSSNESNGFESEVESEYGDGVNTVEEDLDNVTSDLTSAWMLRDKELENAIRNLQYNSNVITYNYNEKDNSTQFEEWIIRISSTVDRKLLSMLETK